MSLRSTLTALTILVTVVAVLVSGALAALTTMLHSTTVRIGSALDSVRLVEEAEIDLLLHSRMVDPVLKRGTEGELRRKLLVARSHVATEEEARVLAEAEKQVDSYFHSHRDSRQTPAERVARQEAAYDALDALVTINVAQSDAARQEAARWDELGDLVGFGGGALIVIVSGALLIWLWRYAFAPILGLASAMERFGRGDVKARAEESGSRELREICVRFNGMAATIADQRQAQIAYLGGVAHDLRNPLSALRMSLALIGPGKRLPSEDKLLQAFERIGRQVTRMERMLGDFLDAAKIEAGQLDLRFEDHDARALMEEVVGLLEGMAREHQLTVRAPADAVIVRCDCLRIEEVLINLISNAIKYSPAGSLVKVGLEARDGEIELSVADQGIGLSEQERAHVFDPFRRVGLSKEAVPGVGLGLFVVRRIVEAHHGRVEVESAPGQGSTFRVLLPVARDGQASSHEGALPPQPGV